MHVSGGRSVPMFELQKKKKTPRTTPDDQCCQFLVYFSKGNKNYTLITVNANLFQTFSELGAPGKYDQ